MHDDAKDKDFELELSWISPQTGWKHAPVPKALAAEAERKAKEIIDAANEMVSSQLRDQLHCAGC